jgi:hypothetical protein
MARPCLCGGPDERNRWEDTENSVQVAMTGRTIYSTHLGARPNNKNRLSSQFEPSQRFSAEIIRSGADSAVVEAQFAIPPSFQIMRQSPRLSSF